MRLLCLFLTITTLLFSQDLSTKYKYILDLYNKSPLRANLSDINQVKSPFYITQNIQTDLNSSTLKLEAIIENRVKINSNWYELGQSCQEICILEIENQTVIILHNNNKIRLSISEVNNDIKVF